MTYYSEEATAGLRVRFEREVLRWPHVDARKMFGCPSYRAKGVLFAFLVTHGVVITRLARADREAVSRQCEAGPFRAGTKVVRAWLRLPVKSAEDLGRTLRWVKKSYRSALQGAPRDRGARQKAAQRGGRPGGGARADPVSR